MIAVDTSALMAILQSEPHADACIAALKAHERILMSAMNVAEALIVGARRNLGPEMANIINSSGFEIVPVTEETAVRVAQVYERWGKGLNPAGLNIGDCFAYDVAAAHACPLLFVGADFSRTDVPSVL